MESDLLTSAKQERLHEDLTQSWEEEFSIVFRYLAFAFYSPHSVLVLIPG